MQFNSWEFLWFTAAMLVIYWAANRQRWLQQLILVIGSYYFYSRLHILFPVYLAALTLAGYLFGRMIAPVEKNRKTLLVAGIVVLSSCLVVLKYANFGISIINSWGAEFALLKFLVPVGLSFYTFSSVGYIVDVYRRRITEEKDLLTYAAYISFFPHLLAGPIAAASSILPQFRHRVHFRADQLEPAVRQICWGLFKKMVIADNISVPVNYCFAHAASLNSFSLYLGIVLFSFQIYTDFSGYSEIARGVASLFGIDLFANFKQPFLSRNPAEFWRRWHTSLTRWLTDYLYRPLGGRSSNKYWYTFVLLFIFFFSGLWHGASWTFICWGLLNGIYFLPYVFSFGLQRYQEPPDVGRMLPRWKTFWQIFFTFHIITFSRILFKSNTLTQAGDYAKSLFTHHYWAAPPAFLFSHLHWCVLLVVLEWMQRFRSHPLDIKGPSWFRYILYTLVIGAIILFHKKLSLQEYYYFRF